MKAKWYFGALIILFVVLGFTKNEVVYPNQGITLNFTDGKASSNEIEDAIALVKKQLQSIGAQSVKVLELESGQLKITYYCTTAVAQIEKLLSEDFDIQVEDVEYPQNSNIPSRKKEKDYRLDVFEIHKANDTESGLNGKCVLSFKQDLDRFYKPNAYILFNNKINEKQIDNDVHVAIKVLKNIAIAINNTSQNIPEVRAGPHT